MIIRELGKGKYSDCFKVRDESGHAVAVKLSYYQEATIRAVNRHALLGDRTAACVAKDKDAISVAMAMSEVAHQMKLHRVSPHFVRVYCEADARNMPLRLRPFLAGRLPTLTPNQIKYAHVCCMELYSCTLTSLITKYAITDEVLKPALFQVVYTLACLQSVFPGFRHNDLSSNNVLIKRTRPLRVRYNINGCAFEFTCALAAALADFDFTHVPGHAVLSNERVLSGKYHVSSEPNDSYDVHLLLQSVLKLLCKTKRCLETQHFITGLDLGSHDRPRSLRSHIVPHRLLAHPYFAALRAGPRRVSVDREYGLPT